MTTSSSIVNVSAFTTTAKFQAWGSATSAAIQASGLTLTTDTGQVNWGTVAFAATTNTKLGYEIYKFNDTLQSTAPIFLRIDYGTGNATSGAIPSTWLTVGTGTDGAGNITGSLFAVRQGGTGTSSAGTAGTNTTMTVRASYSTTAGAAFIDPGTAPAASTGYNVGSWVIQRTCDSSGNPTGAGFCVLALSGFSVGLTQWAASFNPYTIMASRNPAVGVLNTGSTTVSGSGVIELYRCYITAPTPLNSQGAVGYLTTDITQGATFSATPWGSTPHTYVALGAQAAVGFEQGANANICAAVIWE